MKTLSLGGAGRGYRSAFSVLGVLCRAKAAPQAADLITGLRAPLRLGDPTYASMAARLNQGLGEIHLTPILVSVEGGSYHPRVNSESSARKISLGSDWWTTAETGETSECETQTFKHRKLQREQMQTNIVFQMYCAAWLNPFIGSATVFSQFQRHFITHNSIKAIITCTMFLLLISWGGLSCFSSVSCSVWLLRGSSILCNYSPIYHSLQTFELRKTKKNLKWPRNFSDSDWAALPTNLKQTIVDGIFSSYTPCWQSWSYTQYRIGSLRASSHWRPFSPDSMESWSLNIPLLNWVMDQARVSAVRSPRGTFGALFTVFFINSIDH